MIKNQRTILVVGLGNPGDNYKMTYHNVGFMAVDFMSYEYGVKLSKKECESLTGVCNINGVRVVFSKPTTYMNLSGIAVKQLVKKYSVNLNDVFVIYDDIDIENGKYRLRLSGSAGTHNGMKSVINELDTQDIPRIRIGIGKPLDMPLIEFVLSQISSNDLELINSTVVQVHNELESIIKSMN